MSLNFGYLASSAIFAVIFLVLVGLQVKASRFHPALFWATIVATTTLGTTFADFADRSLGIGYPGGVAIVASLLAASLLIWRWSEGTVSVVSINTPKAEWFYWFTILFSQTLGTALGDWLAGTDRGGLGLGYEYGALVFGAGLAVVAALYFLTAVSRTTLFWAAFILTRPLGATLGDLLDKPLSSGGLNVSRWAASLVLLGSVAACVAFLPQRAGYDPLRWRENPLQLELRCTSGTCTATDGLPPVAPSSSRLPCTPRSRLPRRRSPRPSRCPTRCAGTT
jgi:uncharacterized membrane-anchored protein